jgi:hypothetical protein
MLVAALVDLGVPESVVLEAVAQAGLRGFHVHFTHKTDSGIVATKFEVHVDDAQPERTYGSIKKLLAASKLPADVKRRAQLAFAKLAESEARVHRMPLEEVHFHEVGAVDCIVDIVGSAAALAYLDAEVVVSPLPMGRGFVKARHGILPLPAPATVHCLRGFQTIDAGIDAELVTPTGAAVVAANATRSVRWPSMSPMAIGFGAGTRRLPDRPNLLRAVLGDMNDSPAVPTPATHVEISANVDDMTGEMIAYCMQALLSAGALDAWTTPATMKKGRPANVLFALAEDARAAEIARVMISESTTLGVRMHGVSRLVRPRKMRTVDTRFGKVPVKVSGGAFGPELLKPEFDVAAELATAHGVPVRQVLAEALRQAEGAHPAPEPLKKKR